MRKVLDANCFQDGILEEYLATSPQNLVVFTDVACMETFKGNALVNIRESTRIVAKYPGQVAVLKSTRDIVRMQDRGSGVGPEELIDETQTHGFGEFCTCVERASQGEVAFIEQVLEHGRQATRHFDRMLAETGAFATSVKMIAKILRREHLGALRKKAPLSREDAQDMSRMILTIAAELFRDHPDTTTCPRDPNVLRATYLFRYAIAAYLLAERWISDGGVDGVKPEKLRNDLVDVTYIAYATFFDGLLSRDNKVLRIFTDAKFLLDELFISG